MGRGFDMAAADYRLCDVCGGKVFYDSDLDYEFSTGKTPIDSNKMCRDGYRLQYLGDWKVICLECAKKFKCVIIPISDTP